MYGVHLINMPFAALHTPSIALTQLKSVTEQKLGDQVSIEIAYVNHDFAKFIGLTTYNLAALNHEAHMTGIGDWLFRQSAFPDFEDNSEKYFSRYYPSLDERTLNIKQLVAKIRQELDRFFERVIQTYKFD